MRQDRCGSDNTGSLVDSRGLYGRDLLLAQSLAHDFQATGKERVARAIVDAIHTALRNAGAFKTQTDIR
jgi:hypothetical protein